MRTGLSTIMDESDKSSKPMARLMLGGMESLFKRKKHYLVEHFNTCSRDEKKKVDAVKQYYEDHATDDDTAVRMLTRVGVYGTPVFFLAFASVYWTTGMAKYFIA